MLLPIWFLLVALLTEIMAAVVGFGSSTVLTPVAALIFDVKTALAIVAVFHVTGAILRLVRFRSQLDRTFLLNFGLPTVLATLLGAILTMAVSSKILLFLLGLFLIFIVVYEWTHPRVSLPRTKTLETISGAMVGFTSGLLGVGGALRAASLQAFGMKKEEYAGSSAAIAVAADLTRLPVYLVGGYLGGIPALWLIILIILAAGGTIIGLNVIERVPQRTFRLTVLTAVALVAVKIIADGLK